MSIKGIRVEIFPETRLTASREVYECRIEVEDWETGKHTLNAFISNDDFISRFDLLMDRAKQEIKDRIQEGKKCRDLSRG